MVASLLGGQFAWRPLYGGQLSRDQFAAVSCPCSCESSVDLDDLMVFLLTFRQVNDIICFMLEM